MTRTARLAQLAARPVPRLRMRETGGNGRYSQDISAYPDDRRANCPAWSGKIRHRVCQFWTILPHGARARRLDDDPPGAADGVEGRAEREDAALLEEHEEPRENLGCGEGVT